MRRDRPRLRRRFTHARVRSHARGCARSTKTARPAPGYRTGGLRRSWGVLGMFPRTLGAGGGGRSGHHGLDHLGEPFVELFRKAVVFLLRLPVERDLATESTTIARPK